MPETVSLAPLLAALEDLVGWFKGREVPGVVIGGVAASVLGRPRMTRDVDAWKFCSLSGASGGISAGSWEKGANRL
jgi:hypothetical protein